MINLSKIDYRVVCVTTDGTQLDITNVVTDLGWEEGERELSVRISMRINNAKYKGKYMSEIVQPITPIFIYAIIAGQSTEVVRGTVASWTPVATNGAWTVEIVAYDEMIALRRNQDNKYYSDGTGTKAMITDILESWGVPYDYQGPDITHNKMVFKKQYLSDMVLKILDDAKKKGAGFYFLRAREGTVQVLPRGSNTDVYHFDAMENLMQTRDSYDASSIVTRVIIVGKSDSEGHQSVESTIDGKTEYGVRQVIYEIPADKNLDEATVTANEILKEKGTMKRKTNLVCPDLPMLRKGDRIRVRSGTVSGYFFVKSIRHNAADQQMNLEIDEDKEKNAEANGSASDTAETATDDTTSSESIDTDTSDEYSGDDEQ